MDTLKDTLASVLNVRPGEGQLTMLLMLHAFCLGLATVSFSTAASALFLAAFDVGMLPYVYIGSAGTAVLLGLIYTQLQSRLSLPTLFTGTLCFLLLIVVAFRLGLWVSDSQWLAFALLFWLRMFLILASLEFWGLAGRLYNVRQGKRLFSLIGAGELSASILGGFATPFYVMLFGTSNLLLASMLGLGLSIVMLQIILRRFRNQLTTPSQIERPSAAPSRFSVMGLLRHPYVRLLVLSNVLMVIVYNFVDYTFYDYTKTRFQDEMHLAIFLGPFFAVAQVINVLTKTFLAGRLFNRLGLQFGLLFHPMLLIAGGLLLVAIHQLMGPLHVLFWLVAIIKLSDDVLWTSIYDPSLLILYQPLPAEQRRAAQAAVQSIFGPLAIGISGVTLLLLGTREHFVSVHLAYIMPVILAGAIILTRRLKREYPKVLTQALSKRTLEDIDLSFRDDACITLFQQTLASPHAGEVIYALEMLERGGHEALPAFLIELLKHPQVAIRHDALCRIERLKPVGAEAAVTERMAAESLPHLRAAAVRAFCALGEADAVEAVTPYLNDPQPALRMGAMVGLLRYSGIEGVLAAGEYLMAAARAPEPSSRVFAARGLGEVGLANFYQPLASLLQDGDAQVRLAALEAAGIIQHPKLWPIVLNNLTAPDVGHAAVRALSAGGEAALPALATAFAEASHDRERRVRLARVFGRIRGHHTVHILRDYIDVPDASVRTRVLTSLCLSDYRATNGEHTRVLQQVIREGETAAWLLAATIDLGETEAVALPRAALLNSLHQLRHRLFLLLSFMVDAEPMRQAWQTFSHSSAEKRAYALEVVDVLVPPDLKSILLPLLEDLSLGERLQRLRHRFPQTRLSCAERLQDIVMRPDMPAWPRACALRSLAELSGATSADTVMSALSDSDPLIRETAAWALARLTPHAQVWISRVATEGRSPVLTTIERVIILKTVPIFAETPDDVLADVATILDEMEVNPGEVIFEKGDAGSCMYIIVDGEVRVYDGERTLRHLGERHIFGELAVLDPEPRSASIAAVAPTRLFRLNQEAFYDLMADRIEVTRGIIRVLCQQLRSGTMSVS